MEYFFVDQTSCSCLMNVDLSNDTIQGKGLAKVKSLTYKLKYNMCISYVYVYHMHMYICVEIPLVDQQVNVDLPPLEVEL